MPFFHCRPILNKIANSLLIHSVCFFYGGSITYFGVAWQVSSEVYWYESCKNDDDSDLWTLSLDFHDVISF